MSEFNHKQWIQDIVNNENTKVHEANPFVVYNSIVWPELIKQVTSIEGRTWRHHLTWRFTFEAISN